MLLDRLKVKMNPTLAVLKDWIWPPLCYGCDQIILDQNRKYLCFQCFHQIEFMGRQCDRCAKPIVSKESKCLNCIHEIHWKKCFSFFLNNGIIQKIIYAIKFENAPFLIDFLISLQQQKIIDTLLFYPINGIICVPMTSSKKRQRSYNQSEYIAKSLSSLLDVPFYDNVIIKNKETLSQTHLKRIDRKKNLNSCFEVGKKNNLIKGKNILIVDDVLTTGETLIQCCRLAKEIGANILYTYTLARSTEMGQKNGINEKS